MNMLITPYTAINDLDKKLERYLPHRDGFFIEAGAYDGVEQSNTFFFEHAKGWRGVLVEPIPHLAKACVRNRTGSVVCNAALVSREYLKEHSTVEMINCNLMSIVKGAMGSPEKDQEHVAAGEQCQSIKASTITVRAETLDNILEQAPIEVPWPIDLLSLDVEGFELEALGGFSLSVYKPRYVLVETRNKEALDTYMQANSYEFVEMLSYHDALYRPDTKPVTKSFDVVLVD